MVNDCQIARAAIEAPGMSDDNGFAATSPRAVLSVVGKLFTAAPAAVFFRLTSPQSKTRCKKKEARTEAG
jgi:hypothetical protein